MSHDPQGEGDETEQEAEKKAKQQPLVQKLSEYIWSNSNHKTETRAGKWLSHASIRT